MKDKFPIGITLFGLYFIIASLYVLYCKLMTSGYYSWYSSIFYPLPEQVIFLRYICSILYRVVGLISGIGILLHKENFRKVVLFLSWLTISTVYWKHPFYAVEKHFSMVINTLRGSARPYDLGQSPIIKFTWIVLIGLYAFDIGVSAATIYYFSRPNIKKQFRKE